MNRAQRRHPKQSSSAGRSEARNSSLVIESDRDVRDLLVPVLKQRLTPLFEKNGSSISVDEVFEKIDQSVDHNVFPYHSFSHAVLVGSDTYDVLGHIDGIGEYEQQLGLLAGLFHDFGYLGEKNDLLNIAYTRGQVKPILKKIFPKNRKARKQVQRAIISTLNRSMKRDTVSAVLHDMDLSCTVFHPFMMKKLSVETGREVDAQSTRDFISFAQFSTGLKPYVLLRADELLKGR